MTCGDFLRFIDTVPLRLRSDGELSVAREHAEGCPSCAVRWAEAESLEQALGSLPTMPSMERLVADVMERVHGEVAERPAVRRPAPETRVVGTTSREKLGWAAAIAANLALLGVYLYNLDTSAWLSGILSPAAGFRTERISWMLDSGSGILIVAAGALLLAVSILALPGSVSASSQ